MIRESLRHVLLRGKLQPALADELVQRIALDPRSHRAIYDPHSGFLASWYMQLRAEEECARTFRHCHSLTVVLVEPQQGYEQGLRAWLQTQLRSTDLICRRHDRQYLILLPETDNVGASIVIKRILSEFPLRSFKAVELNTGFEQFRELIRSLDIPWGRAA